MSGSLTVIGGVNGSTITGLVTVPAALPSGSVLSNLQTFLTQASAAVTGGGANFANYVVANQMGPYAVTVGSGAAGLLDLSNTDAFGSTVSGNATVNVTVPDGYEDLVVQAPGTETITGNNSSNFLAAFGNGATVSFNTGGSGTVAALGPSDYVGLINGSWSVVAASGDSIASSAANATIDTYGTANVVGILGGSSTVNSAGTGDLVETYNSGVSAVVNVTGADARILVDGGSDTVFANAGQTGVNAFFNLSGGSLYFVNNSTTAASVTGGVDNAIGGSATAFGGVGGGTYVGGPGGNNSLVGGSGLVSLYGSGTGNFLEANGSVTGSASNLLAVNNAGSSTLLASATTNNNQFFGGSAGTSFMSTAGAGQQNFFIGNGDTETLTGSTVSGATNIYHFEAPSTGGGTVYITNFKLGANNQIAIDELAYQGQVTIAGANTVGGGQGGTFITLSDNTTIKLIGTYLTQAQITSITGSNGFS